MRQHAGGNAEQSCNTQGRDTLILISVLVHCIYVLWNFKQVSQSPICKIGAFLNFFFSLSRPCAPLWLGLPGFLPVPASVGVWFNTGQCHHSKRERKKITKQPNLPPWRVSCGKHRKHIWPVPTLALFYWFISRDFQQGAITELWKAKMQSTIGLLCSRKSGEATGGWISVFWRNFDTCFPDMLDTNVQAGQWAWTLAKLQWLWHRDGWVQPGEYGKDCHKDSRCGMEDLENICLFHFLVISLIKANWNYTPHRGSEHGKWGEQLLPCQEEGTQGRQLSATGYICH